MFINEDNRLVKNEGEEYKITFDGANIGAPSVQELKRTLVIHAPPSGSVGGAKLTHIHLLSFVCIKQSTTITCGLHNS